MLRARREKARHSLQWHHGPVPLTLTSASRRSAAVSAALSLTMLLGACSAATTTGADDSAGGSAPQPKSSEVAAGVSHVHGLDLDETTGFVHVATHTGLLLAPMPHDGETVSAAMPLGDWRGDAMGFVRVGDRLYVSGHPAHDEDAPPVIGLRASDLTGDEWTTIGLDGEVDFHALTAGGTSKAEILIAGLDSVSGRVLVSPNDGEGWQEGATLGARSLAFDDDAATLFATSARGLLASTDRGRTFSPVVDAPSLVLLASSPVGATTFLMAGVDIDGALHLSTDGLTWEAAGELPFLPEAIAVGEQGALAIADTREVAHSVDRGANWNTIVRF